MTDANDPDPRAERIAASITETLGENDQSRRGFLSRSVLAGGALLAIGGATGSTIAQSDGNGETAAELVANFDDVEGTDIDVLNYALRLERLEDAFYSTALETFTEEDFVQSPSLESYSQLFRLKVYGYLETVAEHESTHVDVLTEVVTLLGGEPPAEVTYDFGVETVEDFLALGQVLENTGVAAYAGAAPFVDSPDLLSTALSIHSVEAKHAALFNELNGDSPFPDAFDAAKSQQEVLDAADQFIAPEEPTTPDGNETDTPDGTETDTPDGTETDTPDGTETATPDGTETATPDGTETATPDGTETATPDGNGTTTTTAGNETT